MLAFKVSTEQTLPERRVHSNFTIFNNVILDFQITIRDRKDGSVLVDIRFENSAVLFLRDLALQILNRTQKLEKGEIGGPIQGPNKSNDENALSIVRVVPPPLEDAPAPTPEHFLEVIGSQPIVEDQKFITSASEGLSHYAPELCQEGVSSTYFLRDKDDRIVGVFKPLDEEDPRHNPKSRGGGVTSPRKGIRIGEAAQRERAAYLLDREKFFGVPPTYMVNCSHPSFNPTPTNRKVGSLQEFVESDCSAEEMSFSRFPVREVHKIGILDVQILNTDRHGGNILVRKDSEGSYQLVPIDHALSLPDSLDEAWFEWLHSPQAKRPFDAEELAYIERIDINRDMDTLMREASIRPQCLRNMRMTTTLMKKGARAGLNLHQIGSMICREDPEQPSTLENMCKMALESVGCLGDDNEESFFQRLEGLMDEEISGRTCPR